MKYRSEIDGLRTVAVLPVILFHAGLGIFQGGFVGVDIFFVISGYLITTILLAELETGTFSILKFYERRARRILPALYLVMLTCIPFAWFYMLPEEFSSFAKSVVSVVLFSSNFLFWRESGYFDLAADSKPLLHTWSLAVEEQYYIFFPLMLAFLWRFGRKTSFRTIVVLSLLSLALCEFGWRYSATPNFYLMPPRAWELFAGSLCAFIMQKNPPSGNNYLSVAGLGLLLVSIFAYSEAVPFPSLFTLAPVVGSALIILYARQGTLVASLLSTRLFVGIGLISYSAYLWHQPLFAFARLRGGDHPDSLLMMALAALSFLLAYLTWRFVEKPFRGSRPAALVSRKSLFATSATVGAVFIVAGAAGVAMQGNVFRYDPAVANLFADRPQWEDMTWRNKKKYELANFADDARPKLFVIGDSTSGDLLDAFIREFGDEFQYSSATINASCGDLAINRTLIEPHIAGNRVVACHRDVNYNTPQVQKLLAQADMVAISSLWEQWEARLVGQSLAALTEKYGNKFYISGLLAPDFDERKIFALSLESLPDYRVEPLTYSREINREIALAAGDRYLDREAAFCADGLCNIFNRDSQPLFYDNTHLTTIGQRKLGAYLRAHPLAAKKPG